MSFSNPTEKTPLNLVFGARVEDADPTRTAGDDRAIGSRHLVLVAGSRGREAQTKGDARAKAKAAWRPLLASLTDASNEYIAHIRNKAFASPDVAESDPVSDHGVLLVSCGLALALAISLAASIGGSSRQAPGADPGELIDAIHLIAVQTGILASNAAEEAARAGEQGRALAVLASRVRRLAQRSTTVANAIRASIGRSVDTVGAAIPG